MYHKYPPLALLQCWVTTWPRVVSSPSRMHRGLSAAIRAGDAEQVRGLLAGGVPVDARDEHGKTPLMCASEAPGRTEVLVPLL